MPRQLRYALVVGAILLVIAGFLPPAVLRVREAAARSVCASHLKQLSVAIHNYAAANQDYLPTGTVPRWDLPPERRLSWHVLVLPYREQEKVFKQFDLLGAVDDERNRPATEHRFRHIVCPASGEYERTDREAVWKSPGPVTHYVGVAGVGADAATLREGDPRAGAFGYARRMHMPRDFPDGTSNTLLVMETGLNPGHWAFGGPATVRAVEPDAAPLVGIGRPFGGFHAARPGRFWENDTLCMVAMADASIRSIRPEIDPKVLAALATAAGKEPLPENW